MRKKKPSLEKILTWIFERQVSAEKIDGTVFLGYRGKYGQEVTSGTELKTYSAAVNREMEDDE